MVTHLSSSSIARAIDHLSKYGDTDVFPHLPEIVFLHEMKDKVVAELSSLDLDSFSPAQAVETISPKSRYGFRVVHQLLLLETLLFLSSSVEIAEDLEKIKRPIAEFGPFAYRFSSNANGSLFLTGHTYRDWLEWQLDKITAESYDYVICTDIADFYQRIYLHRIENCLDTATANKGIKKFIEKLIKQVRSKQSYGIPVGGTASRFVAEAVLADSDSALADEELEFTRFVDDFRIFVKPGQTPYSILAFLADQLAASEGLALNAQKTRLYKIADFRNQLRRQLGDVFDTAEKDAIEALSHACYFDEAVAESDILKLRSMNLLEMLKKEVQEESWDFGKIKAIFRALRFVPDPNSISFFTQNFEFFLPFVKDLVLYLDEMRRTYNNVTMELLRDKILAEISGGAASSVPTIRVWLLELFVRQVISVNAKDISKFSRQHTLDNRQVYLINGLRRDVNYFRRQRARFDEKNNFEKFSFMMGATCLPKDEFENWIAAIRPNMNRPLDRLFCDWIKTKTGKLGQILEFRASLVRD